jgi:hypothetical protein
MMYRKKLRGREKKNLYIYNLTKLKGNEMEGKTEKKRNFFFYKEKKTNKAKPKNEKKKTNKKKRNE